MRPKQKGRVVSIQTNDQSKLLKFMAFRILPGVTIALIQSFPSYVLQIGQSQFAIDKELARSIVMENI